MWLNLEINIGYSARPTFAEITAAELSTFHMKRFVLTNLLICSERAVYVNEHLPYSQRVTQLTLEVQKVLTPLLQQRCGGVGYKNTPRNRDVDITAPLPNPQDISALINPKHVTSARNQVIFRKH
jgi:hypothetical protein